jgi:DNA-binding MarR family transcriptional regulator
MRRRRGFRRLTPKQKEVLRAIRQLGELTVTPNDARPLKALWRRGWIRYKRDDDGVRIAVLRAKIARRWCAWRGWQQAMPGEWEGRRESA